MPRRSAGTVWLPNRAMQGGRPTLGTCTPMAGVSPRTMAEAVRWFRMAAEQGDARGQANLGNMYANGEGVLIDEAEAVRWFRLAAEQGHAGSQLNLGVMYAKGQGVLKDEAGAARWLRLAAEQGEAIARYNLGIMYAIGEGRAQG